METSLHRQLKAHYAVSPDQIEVKLGAYRIDVVRGDELIEIQCASLSAIRRKVVDLTKRHRVRIVKPSVARTRICRRDHKGGETVSRRMSPKRGEIHDLFEELIYLRDVFPHPNLTLEFPVVDVDQHRLKTNKKKRRRRNPGFVVEDVALREIHESLCVHEPDDLWQLLPAKPADNQEFNTADLSELFGCERWIAQRIAYVLRHTEAIKTTGRDRTGIRYTRVAKTAKKSSKAKRTARAA